MTSQRLNWFLEIIRQTVFRHDFPPGTYPFFTSVSSVTLPLPDYGRVARNPSRVGAKREITSYKPTLSGLWLRACARHLADHGLRCSVPRRRRNWYRRRVVLAPAWLFIETDAQSGFCYYLMSEKGVGRMDAAQTRIANQSFITS